MTEQHSTFKLVSYGMARVLERGVIFTGLNFFMAGFVSCLALVQLDVRPHEVMSYLNLIPPVIILGIGAWGVYQRRKYWIDLPTVSLGKGPPPGFGVEDDPEEEKPVDRRH